MIAALAATLNTPAPARAATCGTVSGDTGNNLIVLGEQASYFWYGGQQYFYGLGKLMSCVKDSAGSWSSTVLTGCTSTTSSSDHVLVTAGSGNDQLAPNTQSPQSCELGQYMIAWNPGVLSFGIEAHMGTGSDTAHGSGNDDDLYSNIPGTFIPFNPTPADSANDTLCGWLGDDSLVGDKDDSTTFQERLGGGEPPPPYGGTDSDSCNGGNDGSTFDQYFGDCETHSAAALTTTNPCTSIPDLIPW